MKHAREDYNRIQDPENKIGEDEPVFLLRATDKYVVDAIMHWASLVEQESRKPDEIANMARNHAMEMYKWQQDNPEKVHHPNLP